MQQRLAYFGILMVSVLIITAVAAPWLAPHDPLSAVADCFGEPLSPRQGFWFGTDELGRDVLSRVLFGARVSLVVAFCATTIALTIGVTVGTLAGYLGGWTDLALMRLTDVMLAFPALLLVVAMSAVFQPGLTSIFVVIGLVSWTTVARTVRAEVLSLRQRDFITASISLGNRTSRVLVRHILPNVLPTIVIMAALGSSSTILLDAGLSYLGLGVPVPTPSWGRMIADSRTYYRTAPWLMLFPGVAIVFAVLAFNLLGYGLLAILNARRGGSLEGEKP